MPGCLLGSWGFHGNDEMFYNPMGGCIKDYGESFCLNDVIGCCVDYDADQLFFTMNRKYLGTLQPE